MERLKIAPKNLRESVKKAVELIKQGGVVICPTDTVYGLIANAKSEKAVRQVFKIKKRILQKSIPVFVRDLKMAEKLVFVNKTQEKFFKKVWPGKVTIILKAKTKRWPKGILSKDKKVGLRIPNYKILNILLKKVNLPLTGTSANISGKSASTKIKNVLIQFKNQKYQSDLILDAGNLKPSLPSTVIDLEDFKILREGALSKKKILNILVKIKRNNL